MELIDWVAVGVWIGVIALSFAISLYLGVKYQKSEEKNKIKLAFSLMFLSLAISRLLLMYFDYFITGLNPALYSDHQLFWRLATLFQLLGLGFLIVVSEYAVFRGKDYFIFTIGFLIVVFVGMLIPDFFMAQNVTVYAVAFAAFIPVSWIYLAIKLPLARKNTLLIILGFLLFGVGLILLSAGIVDILAPIIDIHTLYLLSAIIHIPGLSVFTLGVKRYYFSV